MPREIACDESGYEGEHLIGGVTAVFVHAGTDLDVAAAQECVALLRERIRSPAQEYKANHLLRAKHRDALEWLLERMTGRASVHLVDKAYLAATVLDRILPQRDAPSEALLLAVETALRARDAAELAAAAAVLRALDPRIADAVADHRAGELAAPPAFGPLDPLPAAIGATVDRWSAAGPVTLVHDRQTTLSDVRVAALRVAYPALAALVQVPSRSDARVQVADFLAGVAYRITARALAGHPDPVLLELLRPHVDPASLWIDKRSGTALGIRQGGSVTVPASQVVG
ncbi:MAG: NAD-dependent protein deacetylase of SIR2 family [Pseudonocardia sp.]|nr:NAD-dependent protein deacetylase of SIR2 family [Pseudonocardia sp.]